MTPRHALISVVAWGLLASGAARAADTPVKAVKVAEDVWVVQGESAQGSAANRNFISNAGFVVTGDGVVVVDALGSPTLAEELIAEIRRVTSQPIRHVVVIVPDDEFFRQVLELRTRCVVEGRPPPATADIMQLFEKIKAG